LLGVWRDLLEWLEILVFIGDASFIANKLIDLTFAAGECSSMS